MREARAMERIREFLRATNKKPPVMVPRVIPGMVSRYSIITAHLIKVFFMVVIEPSSAPNILVDTRAALNLMASIAVINQPLTDTRMLELN